MAQHISRQFIFFCIVGSIGFVVDAGSLYLLMYLFDWGPYLSRVFSFLLAATATWLLNRAYTFRPIEDTPIHHEWFKYVAYASVGGSINYAVYVLCLLFSEVAHAHPVLGVAAGSIAGLAFNFTATRYLVYRAHE